MTDIKERGDQMEEACGVFGIYAQDESINVAEAAYYGLFALQHRGQESAGIAVADGKGIKHYRNLGLVPEVFDEEILHGLTGRISIGHVRYSTFGSKDVINSQPLVARCKIGMLALAHNGNLVNADALRAQMEDDGAFFQTSVDTEVILSLIARESSKGLIEAVRAMMEKVRARRSWCCWPRTSSSGFAIRMAFARSAWGGSATALCWRARAARSTRWARSLSATFSRAKSS